jgi:hypothetical protein
VRSIRWNFFLAYGAAAGGRDRMPASKERR